jgi:hypothetical protein
MATKKYRMSNEEKQADIDAKLSGMYIIKNGEFIGTLKRVKVIAPPSGFNRRYSVEMYDGTFYTTTRITEFEPVTAQELVKRLGEDVLKHYNARLRQKPQPPQPIVNG